MESWRISIREKIQNGEKMWENVLTGEVIFDSEIDETIAWYCENFEDEMDEIDIYQSFRKLDENGNRTSYTLWDAICD